MSSTKELIQKFNLHNKVDKFVQSEVKNLLKEKHNFFFEGSGAICRCGNQNPHIPHYTGEYNTVRYGKLGYFCYGVEGEGLHIEIQNNFKGSAERPETYSGFWWVESENEKLE